MSSLLAAVGATVAALLETTIVPHLVVAGAHPHLVLVLGVVWTVAAGVENGLVWAFAGGLALDIFAQRPIGSSAFALLVSIGGAAVVAPLFSRARRVAPVPLVFLFSFVNSLLLLLVYGALRAPVPAPDVIPTLLPGVLYDTVIAALIGPLAISARDRHVDQERADW
ncbi:MAG TPA: rod shape-determining protein MreD [Candidatus Limnocylindrales bacterium]|jgi:rod shape-determining protein MreD|nr:rod shape-determining protein MreD [Candidatus Limnocylindrales bacterium]